MANEKSIKGLWINVSRFVRIVTEEKGEGIRVFLGLVRLTSYIIGSAGSAITGRFSTAGRQRANQLNGQRETLAGGLSFLNGGDE